MTDITWPASLVPNESQWGLESNTAVFPSPLVGTVTTLERPGARWRQVLTFSNLSEAETRLLEVFLMKLRGQANRVLLYKFGHEQQGTLAGTPVVDGASQTGNTLNTSGWTPSSAVLKAGDMFQVGYELKVVTEDVSADGSGDATVTFEPPLRASPSNGAPLILSYPKARFVLTAPGWVQSNTPGIFSGFTLDFIEAF